MDNIWKTAFLSLLINIAFGAYHIVSGIVTRSWWLLTVGVYYAILSVVRFAVLIIGNQERFVTRLTGAMLMLLTLPLAGTVILSLTKERGHRLHEIIVISMAAYAFTKITLAITHMIKSRKSKNAKLVTLRSISLADACVSLFALQRSMLASFGNMSMGEIRIFHALLGASVCVVVFLLGLTLSRQ